MLSDPRPNMNSPGVNKNPSQTTPTVSSNSISPNATQLAKPSTGDSNTAGPNPSVEVENSDTVGSKSRLVPASRRIKKTSVTGAPPSKADEPVKRQRAMTLPR